MKIGIYISELLFDHESVIVPGLGTFSTQYVPARFIPEEKKVESPSRIIAFNQHLKEGETPLIHHIANRESVDQGKVRKFIADFVSHMHESLQAGSKVELQNVGIFSLNPDGDIAFVPDRSINYLGDASGLSSVKEPAKPAPDLQPVKEKEVVASSPKAVDKKEQVVAEAPEKEEAAGLPPALKWIAYTVVPVLIVIIILAFNYRFIFGSDGLFGTSAPVATQQILPPQPEAPVQQIPLEEEPLAAGEAQVQAFDAYAQPPRPEPGRPVYYIIVGSFEQDNQAEAFALELRKKGADLAGVYMQTPKGFHRVAYGYYYDLQKAEEQLNHVQQQIEPNAWILHR